MSQLPVVAEVYSVRGHRIRLTLRQWVHIIENHDYTAGNREPVLETLADPDGFVITAWSTSQPDQGRAKG